MSEHPFFDIEEVPQQAPPRCSCLSNNRWSIVGMTLLGIPICCQCLILLVIICLFGLNLIQFLSDWGIIK